jgi:alanine racemase
VGRKAAEVAGLFITEGGEAAAAARAALDWGMDARTVRAHFSAEDTIAALTSELTLTDNDIVLVKGGPSTRMGRVVRALLKEAGDAGRLEVLSEDSDGVETTFQPLRPTWVEIDMNAVARNARALKRLLDPGVGLMAVVKADAYGHGAVAVAQTAALNGAEYLAVANLEEALELRYSGVNTPILVLGYTPVYATRQALRQNIAVTLYDLDMARGYARAAREAGGRLRVHVKLDTGMGRLGLMPAEAVSVFRQLSALPALDIEGLYTHFSSADEDAEFTAAQVETFRGVIRPLRAGGFNFRYIHAANSAGTLAGKENHFSMVRPGLALYGLHPSDKVRLPDGFAPAMTWKTVVAQVKTLPANHYVGYGNTYRTRGPETIAVLPIGYADGFRRWPNWGEVLVRGQRAPIIGRISMEKTTISVASIPGVAVGDEVVLLGTQGEAQITAEEVALRLGTINYEVVCNVLARVPRR